jgi:hypothetical protein
VHQGQREQGDNIERCVSCHAIEGADGTPVGYDDPKHFCGSCHRRAAVTVDCFECHNSRIPKQQESALPSIGDLAESPATNATGAEARP